MITKHERVLFLKGLHLQIMQWVESELKRADGDFEDWFQLNVDKTEYEMWEAAVQCGVEEGSHEFVLSQELDTMAMTVAPFRGEVSERHVLPHLFFVCFKET